MTPELSTEEFGQLYIFVMTVLPILVVLNNQRERQL